MHKKKNQKPTTNLVVQKQADTSQVKKPKPTQAQPIPQKEEYNSMKIIAYTDNPTALKNAIDKYMNDNELNTWEIVRNVKNEVLYSHTPEQWNQIAMPKPYIYDKRTEFKISWWNKNKEPNEAIKGYITGRFTEILMVHFREQFTHLEIK